MDVSKYNFDFDGIAAKFLAEKTAAYQEPKNKRAKGPSKKMYGAILASVLTNTSRKEIAKHFGIPYDSFKNARSVFRDFFLQDLSEFYALVFRQIVAVAAERTWIRTVTPLENRKELTEHTQAKNRQTVISTETVNPNLFRAVIDFISTFLSKHRNAQRFLLDGTDPDGWATIYSAALDKAYRDRAISDLFALVMQELYFNCLIPLINYFIEKLETVYERRKQADEWKQQAEGWVESAICAFRDITAEVILSYAERLKDDREQAHKCIVNELLVFEGGHLLF